jgi:hypothetical protein
MPGRTFALKWTSTASSTASVSSYFWEFRGRGKTSGLEAGQIRATGAYLFQIRGGKAIRFAYYVDPDRALSDLGLAPEAGSARS